MFKSRNLQHFMVIAAVAMFGVSACVTPGQSRQAKSPVSSAPTKIVDASTMSEEDIGVAIFVAAYLQMPLEYQSKAAQNIFRELKTKRGALAASGVRPADADRQIKADFEARFRYQLDRFGGAAIRYSLPYRVGVHLGADSYKDEAIRYSAISSWTTKNTYTGRYHHVGGHESSITTQADGLVTRQVIPMDQAQYQRTRYDLAMKRKGQNLVYITGHLSGMFVIDNCTYDIYVRGIRCATRSLESQLTDAKLS